MKNLHLRAIAIVSIVIPLFFSHCKNTSAQNETLVDETNLKLIPKFDEATKKWGYTDQTNETVIEPQFDIALSFTAVLLAPVQQFAPVQKNNLWGFINSKGEFVIEPQFKLANFFSSNGLAAASKVGDAWGYINLKGEFAIAPQFESADFFAENGLAAVAVKDQTSETGWRWGYITEDGKVCYQTFIH